MGNAYFPLQEIHIHMAKLHGEVIYTHGPLVKWSNTSASQAGDTGSNPVGVTTAYQALRGLFSF